ncbi:MAG: hypothetical protein JWR42_2313, partial [Marmoricola sp.]|nr:hypothetical protein [Marmoricola sp.]
MLDLSDLVLLVTALLALVALVGLVVGSHLWVGRADSRARASRASRPPSHAAVGSSPRAALVQVGAEDGRVLRDALDRSVRAGVGTSLLVARHDDVMPSSAQLDGAAVALEDPDTGFVTFADDDTAAARVRADRGLVVAAPGPIAVRADAVLDAGGWPEGERLPETDLGARMVGLGWRGAALGVAPGAVCDSRARERQVAWHLVRRHRGLLVARRRRAGADLGPAERSAL